mgnify:FL=1
MEEWISLRAYARHREVALSAVQKAIESQRVTAVRRDAGGRLSSIEMHEADRQWSANTDPVEAARNGKFSAPAGDLLASQLNTPPAKGAAASTLADAGAGTRQGSGASAHEANPGSTADAPGVSNGGEAGGVAAGGVGPGGATTDQGDYLAARAKREGYLSEMARLDHLERLGLLVSTAEVEQEMAEIFGQIKTSVLRVADRKAQILAAESDPQRVHRILNDEFRTAFDELSSRFAAVAAGGTEEPAPAL